MVYLTTLLSTYRSSDENKRKDRVIQVMLYKPPANDPFINRAVAWIDGPFSHVEVGFEDGVASSIYAGETVFMHPRTFSNPNYTTVSLSVTTEQEDNARMFCAQQARRGIEFDGVGMYCARLPAFLRSVISSLRGNGGVEHTFCSKYVVEVMQHIGIDCFLGIDSSNTSPSMVHRILSTNYTTDTPLNVLFGTTPFRRDLLMSGKSVVM